MLHSQKDTNLANASGDIARSVNPGWPGSSAASSPGPLMDRSIFANGLCSALSQDSVDDVTVYVGQTIITSLESKRELAVIESK